MRNGWVCGGSRGSDVEGAEGSSSGDDLLIGDDADNYMFGGGGDDTLGGGLDVDTADFSDADQGVTLTLNADYTGTATSRAT